MGDRGILCAHSFRRFGFHSDRIDWKAKQVCYVGANGSGVLADFWRGKDQRVAGGAALRRQRPNPGIELLRGQFLLEPTQAGVPEILHLVMGLDDSKFYPLRDGLSTAQRALASERAFI